jgi:hypothetical protein
MLEKMTAVIEAKVRAAQPIHGWDATEIARAALEAIREPSDAVIVAGTDVSRAAYEAYCGEAGSDAIYTAMIDAILNEETT